MFNILITASGLGILLSFSFGPMFFELINTSLKKGFKEALLMELGVLFGDIVYLFLALFSASKASEYINSVNHIEYYFGVMFFIFGGVSLFKNRKEPVISYQNGKQKNSINADGEICSVVPVQKNNYIASFMKGLAFNVINPFVLLFWIGVCTTTIKTLDLDNQGLLLFFSITLGVMLGLDILKIYFASRLQKHITPRIIQIIGIGIGIIMIGIGLFIIIVGVDFNGK